MIELIDEVLVFVFFFLLPMLGVCAIPALFMGGVMVNIAEKNKEDKK
jgi:hypothetical protein